MDNGVIGFPKKPPETPKKSSIPGSVTVVCHGSVLVTKPPTEDTKKFVSLVRYMTHEFHEDKPEN